MLKYGNAPKIIGTHYPICSEFMYYVSLPIRLAGRLCNRVPPRLDFMRHILDAAENDALFMLDDQFINHYTYLTVKSTWVTPDCPGNRPGWHVDSYGSHGDLNYIWSDKNPTEFAIQDDLSIPDDDALSMVAMTQQVRPESIVTYPTHTLIRLDESVVHRVGPVIETGRRTFVKIIFSKHQFNLEGNSHNYLFDYDWSMKPRTNGRNLDCK